MQELQGDYAESGSLPDSNTAEAVLYGPAYSWIKSALWVWDEMEDYLERKAASLESQIMDRRWAYEVMTQNRYLIFARSPPVNDHDHLMDLFTLRNLVKCVAGIRKINEYRHQNISWARMKGIETYVGSLAGRGITESGWKQATASFNMEPINFGTVHGEGISNLPEEDIDWEEALRDLMGDKDYDSMMRRMYGIDISGVDPSYPGGREEEIIEPSKEPDMPVYACLPDDLCEALEIMFSDPVQDLMDRFPILNDECSAAADFWEDSDVDDRGIIDQLISFLREAEA